MIEYPKDDAFVKNNRSKIIHCIPGIGDQVSKSAYSLNVLVSLVFYNWYFISYVVTFWLQGLSILILNAVGFKKPTHPQPK